MVWVLSVLIRFGRTRANLHNKPRCQRASPSSILSTINLSIGKKLLCSLRSVCLLERSLVEAADLLSPMGGGSESWKL